MSSIRRVASTGRHMPIPSPATTYGRQPFSPADRTGDSRYRLIAQISQCAVSRRSRLLNRSEIIGYVSNAEKPIEIVGGANNMVLAASWPLAKLIADDQGIVVHVRKRVVPVIGAVLTPFTAERNVMFQSRWDDLTRCITAKRSVVVWRRGGDYCRFVVIRRGRLDSLIKRLEVHRVPLERVRGTFLLGTFHDDRWPPASSR
jgi:hypothetical protein